MSDWFLQRGNGVRAALAQRVGHRRRGHRLDGRGGLSAQRGRCGRLPARQGHGTAERPLAVIAAGERWPDGSLRPALEDLLGAGAIIDELVSHGAGPLSPEAAAARACFTGTPDVAAAVAS
ncbi:hypothetical protein ACQF4J_42955 [Streptomyces sp. C1-1]|uniref:hypothetical protein n=1 Tax=Streptomyces sp. C1-1 TaxID=3231173 RepID=UPI003D095374